MSAPALNVAPVTPPAPGGSTAAKPAGAAAGAFESVLAETAGQTQDATTGAAPAPKTDLTARLQLAGAEGEILPEGEGELDPTDIIILVPPTQADASLALAAAATALAAPATTQTLATPPTETATPPAFGRDKAKGSPAAPALAHANVHADLAEKAVGETDQPLETEVPADIDPQVPAPTPAKAAAPQASAQAAARAAPPSAVVQAAASPDVQAPVAEVASEPLPPAAAEAVSAEAATLSAAALSGRAAAPAAGRPTEPAKAERGKAAVEDVAPAKTAGAVRKTTEAKPAAGTETAPAPAAEAAVAEASAGGRELLDDPDSVGSRAEAPTAGSAAAATGPAAHIVRGSPETVANLAAAIVKKLDARETRFDLELDPHGLGKVDVRIHIGAQGQLTAAMVCDNPQAAAELKARAAELQRQLEQAGFNLSGGISFDVAGDRGHARQGWAETQDQAGPGHRGRAFQAALDTAGEADLASSGPLRMRRGVTAGLDMRI